MVGITVATLEAAGRTSDIETDDVTDNDGAVLTDVDIIDDNVTANDIISEADDVTSWMIGVEEGRNTSIFRS